MVHHASWSQLEPGKTRTPNFIGRLSIGALTRSALALRNKASLTCPLSWSRRCGTISIMPFGEKVGSHLGLHIKIAGGAVWGWLVAQFLDSLTVGALWFVGLLLVKMSWPLALLWAVVGAVCQFIPHFGPVLGLIGPGMTAAAKVTSHWEHYEQLLYVLILYAVIMVVDGLFLQPYFMRRKAKVPMWASIL